MMPNVMLEIKEIVGRRPIAARVGHWQHFRCSLNAATLVSVVVTTAPGQKSDARAEPEAQNQEKAVPASRVMVRKDDFDRLASSLLRGKEAAQLQGDIAESKRPLPILQYGGFVPENDVAAGPESTDRPGSPKKKRG